jgi:hypothetical protein
MPTQYTLAARSERGRFLALLDAVGLCANDNLVATAAKFVGSGLVGSLEIPNVF